MKRSVPTAKNEILIDNRQTYLPDPNTTNIKSAKSHGPTGEDSSLGLCTQKGIVTLHNILYSSTTSIFF